MDLTTYAIGCGLMALFCSFALGRSGEPFDGLNLLTVLLMSVFWPVTLVLFLLGMAYSAGKW